MINIRIGTVVAALSLAGATTIAVAPAHAAPAETGIVQYATPSAGSSDTGSSDDPLISAGLLLVAGVGVSAALAIGAGVAGGAFPLPPIPGS